MIQAGTIRIGSGLTCSVAGAYWISSIRRLRKTTSPGVTAKSLLSLSKNAAHILDRQEDFLAVLPDAEGDEQEIAVDFLSSRTRATVPSRIKRMIGSAANERVFHASQ